MFYSLRTRAVFNGQALTLHKKYSMNILIIGATSGIGKALFLKYATADNRIGIVGRRTSLLNELSQQYPSRTIVSKADVTNLNETEQAINTLLKEFGHLDLAIMCAGVGDINATLDYAIERPAIDTNVVGWTYVIDRLYCIFTAQSYYKKSEMRKNMVMDLIYRGFIYAANYSESHYNPRRSQIKTELRYLFVTTPNR